MQIDDIAHPVVRALVRVRICASVEFLRDLVVDGDTCGLIGTLKTEVSERRRRKRLWPAAGRPLVGGNLQANAPSWWSARWSAAITTPDATIQPTRAAPTPAFSSAW